MEDQNKAISVRQHEEVLTGMRILMASIVKQRKGVIVALVDNWIEKTKLFKHIQQMHSLKVTAEQLLEQQQVDAERELNETMAIAEERAAIQADQQRELRVRAAISHIRHCWLSIVHDELAMHIDTWRSQCWAANKQLEIDCVEASMLVTVEQVKEKAELGASHGKE